MLRKILILSLLVIGSRLNAASNDSDKSLEPPHSSELLEGSGILQEKIRDLQTAVDNLNKQAFREKGELRLFFAESLVLGGFFENSIMSMWGSQSPSETVADRNRLGLNLSAELSEKVQFVSQFSLGFQFPLRNEHNNAGHGSSLIPTQRSYGDVAFGAVLSQAFGQLSFSPLSKMQFGLGFIPFGQAFQVREPVLFHKTNGPQLIRTASSKEIVIADPFWKGIHFLYDFSESAGANLYSTTSLDHGGRMGGGLRLWSRPDSAWLLGISGQRANRSGVSYTASGVDVGWQGQRFGILLEYAQNISSLGDIVSYYIQPTLRILDRRLTVYLDADYLKNLLGVTTLGTASVSDPYVKWEYGFGVNYQFLPNAKVRIGVVQHDYIGNTEIVAGQGRDFNSVINSWSLAF